MTVYQFSWSLIIEMNIFGNLHYFIADWNWYWTNRQGISIKYSETQQACWQILDFLLQPQWYICSNTKTGSPPPPPHIDLLIYNTGGSVGDIIKFQQKWSWTSLSLFMSSAFHKCNHKRTSPKMKVRVPYCSTLFCEKLHVAKLLAKNTCDFLNADQTYHRLKWYQRYQYFSSINIWYLPIPNL
jgi:hypothetical protein